MICKSLFQRVSRQLGARFAVLVLAVVILVASPVNGANPKEHELFVSFRLGGSSKIEAYIASKGFARLPIVYQRYMDRDQDGKLDLGFYIDHIGRRFGEYQGAVALDWEGKAYRRLIGGEIAKEEAGIIISEYVRSVSLLQSVSSKRLEIGFYGFPSKRCAHAKCTEKEVRDLQKLYDSVDILFPSLYLNRGLKSSN